jgi:hypothetical protein
MNKDETPSHTRLSPPEGRILAQALRPVGDLAGATNVGRRVRASVGTGPLPIDPGRRAGEAVGLTIPTPRSKRISRLSLGPSIRVAKGSAGRQGASLSGSRWVRGARTMRQSPHGSAHQSLDAVQILSRCVRNQPVVAQESTRHLRLNAHHARHHVAVDSDPTRARVDCGDPAALREGHGDR